MQTNAIVIRFPKQSKPACKKHPKEKCTVLEWIRTGYQFPGKPNPPKPLPPAKPPEPTPIPGPIPPSPDSPPQRRKEIWER